MSEDSAKGSVDLKISDPKVLLLCRRAKVYKPVFWLAPKPGIAELWRVRLQILNPRPIQWIVE
jgi:hypothetical protein